MHCNGWWRYALWIREELNNCGTFALRDSISALTVEFDEVRNICRVVVQMLLNIVVAGGKNNKSDNKC